MALSRFVLTATVVLPAGAYTSEIFATGGGPIPNAGGNAQGAGTYGSNGGITIPAGTVIYADSTGSGGAGALYTAIGAGNLRAYVPGQDDVGHAALAN